MQIDAILASGLISSSARASGSVRSCPDGSYSVDDAGMTTVSASASTSGPSATEIVTSASVRIRPGSGVQVTTS